MTPVSAPVFKTTPPKDHGGIAVGYLDWRNRGASSEQLMLEMLFAAAVVVVLPLKLVHHHVLSEPLDGRLTAGLEVAGEHTLLRNKAGHGDV